MSDYGTEAEHLSETEGMREDMAYLRHAMGMTGRQPRGGSRVRFAEYNNDGSKVCVRKGGQKKKPKGKKRKKNEVVHLPQTDAEAKALIKRLDWYEWDTHKVSGRFDRNPYHLTATIGGVKHRIDLVGRFGGVLRWLDAQERARYEAREAAA